MQWPSNRLLVLFLNVTPVSWFVLQRLLTKDDLHMPHFAMIKDVMIAVRSLLGRKEF